MCLPDDPCDVLDFDGLVAFTGWYLTQPGWRWRTPFVTRLRFEAEFGRCVGRAIRYADRAPACVVPHELAHLAARTPNHGDTWRTMFVTLCGWATPAG